uniref:Uncharacterized protein n=1 Tax=Amphimedon queenslandica TaxID=400682 RepID=A0A1X7VY85_AMPQE
MVQSTLVHCISNNRQYVINAKKLDTIGGEPFDPEYANIGDRALWTTNGKAYEIEIKGRAGTKESLLNDDHDKRPREICNYYDKKALNPHCLTSNSIGYTANTGSDYEDNFVNPVLAEDGSFVGHFKDTVAVPEKCSVVDSEVFSALKDDVEYLKKKCDSMSHKIEKTYYLQKDHVAANKHISKFESSSRVKTDSPSTIRLDLSE